MRGGSVAWAEAEGEEVGVAEFDAEADGLVRDGGEVWVTFPRDGLRQRIAPERFTVVEREARDGRSLLVLDLEPDASGGAGREVDLEFIALEAKGFCEHLSTVERGVQGGESIDAQGVAAAACEEEGHFGGAGLVDADGCVVGSVRPAVGSEAGADEALGELAIELMVAAGRHEEDVGCGAAFIHEAGGGCDVDMRGTEVGLCATGVEVFSWEVGLHLDEGSPFDEVF